MRDMLCLRHCRRYAVPALPPQIGQVQPNADFVAFLTHLYKELWTSQAEKRRIQENQLFAIAIVRVVVLLRPILSAVRPYIGPSPFRPGVQE